MKRWIISLLALATVQATAQNIKPGMWELNNHIKSGNAQMDQAMAGAMRQLANMPPEQRAQIEAMMAQNGATMPKLANDGGMSMTACITQEMAAKGQIPTGQQGNCTSNNTPVAGGMNIAFSCSNPPSSGTGQLRFNGDSGFSMTTNVTTTQNGKPMQMMVETTGRWTGACSR